MVWNTGYVSCVKKVLLLGDGLEHRLCLVCQESSLQQIQKLHNDSLIHPLKIRRKMINFVH